ncbi:MAG: hypothetical protein ACREIV_08645 [Planctomycetaceae bacterium]
MIARAEHRLRFGAKHRSGETAGERLRRRFIMRRWDREHNFAGLVEFFPPPRESVAYV